jgi:hypothetical protein
VLNWQKWHNFYTSSVCQCCACAHSCVLTLLSVVSQVSVAFNVCQKSHYSGVGSECWCCWPSHGFDRHISMSSGTDIAIGYASSVRVVLVLLYVICIECLTNSKLNVYIFNKSYSIALYSLKEKERLIICSILLRNTTPDTFKCL